MSQFLSERADICMQKNVNNYMPCANLDFSLFLHPFPGFFLLAPLQPCSLAMRLLDDKGVIFGFTVMTSFSVNRITIMISGGCNWSYNGAVCPWVLIELQ